MDYNHAGAIEMMNVTVLSAAADRATGCRGAGVEQRRVGEGGLLVDAAEPREEREHEHSG